MSAKKYNDIPAVVNILSGIFNHPELLELNAKYTFYQDDFTDDFHKIIFGSMYNLYMLGAKAFTIDAIEDYLEERPDKKAIYQINSGRKWLEEAAEHKDISSFDYYYYRMKKMTLFRLYAGLGLDLDWLYDPDNILDSKKKTEQEDYIDHHTLTELADEIDLQISTIRAKHVENTSDDFIGAGENIFDKLEQWKATPDYGYPMFGKYINTITRGAKLKKFYLRSASTGLGKTRSMIADSCYIGCSEYYDDIKGEWKYSGPAQSVLFISTEQEEDEIQSMMIAFLSAVEEEHILTGKYENDEEERVRHAAWLLQENHIQIKKLPDFSLTDIENTIKFAIHQYGVKYIFHDYIHSSIKILSEIGSKAGVKGLREDNILFLISVKLKDICNQYGVFIMSATQLNGGYQDANVYDQNLLRGAKAIADKIDMGMIMIPVTAEDNPYIEPIVQSKGFTMPTIKISVYKNRRGRWKDILLWCNARRGICRIEPMFITDYNYQLIDMIDTELKVEDKHE